MREGCGVCARGHAGEVAGVRTCAVADWGARADREVGPATGAAAQGGARMCGRRSGRREGVEAVGAGCGMLLNAVGKGAGAGACPDLSCPLVRRVCCCSGRPAPARPCLPRRWPPRRAAPSSTSPPPRSRPSTAERASAWCALALHGGCPAVLLSGCSAAHWAGSHIRPAHGMDLLPHAASVAHRSPCEPTDARAGALPVRHGASSRPLHHLH